jgi:hypothetical protein
MDTPTFQVKLLPGLALCLSLLIKPVNVFPQNGNSPNQDTIVIAGKQYQKSSFHQLLWGKHYRKDWATPVNVKFLNLDTVNGGLVAYEKGGGRQTKTLRLRNPAGKEWVLRSIDKSFGKALPDIYRNTFIETIIDDQVSIAQPYAAPTIPGMAEAAGIYHAKPQIYFVPSQKALGEFNKEYGNDLYLLEHRPDENWEEAANFGNSKKIISTEKLLEKIVEDNDNRVDQPVYVRARIFDMFIGDWGRHEDQWRWATFAEGNKKIYKAIPRDRDQVYTKFDGALLSLAISAAGAGHLETFGTDIKNVPEYNYPARNLDRQLANEVSREQWITTAKELQQLLTDKVIEGSVKQLPPEIYVLSGEEIITKLKARREKLVGFATEYYSFLAREVDITGTQDNEFFDIRSLPGDGVQINIYDLNKEGEPKKEPFYSREFFSNETKEIRIYGLKGNDRYNILTSTGNPVTIRIIGGPGKDSYTGAGNRGVHIYDNNDNDLSKLTRVKKHLSEDTAIHSYQYDSFRYDKKGPGIILSYNTDDRIHTGLKYEIEKQQWRKSPFGYRHELAARYSINEGAFSFGYTGRFTKFAGKWNLNLDAYYDLVRWNNFFGIGNETVMLSNDRDFHRVRSKEFYAGIGIDQKFSDHHYAGLTAFYETINILNDPNRFITKQAPPLSVFDTKKFGGAAITYRYQKLDNGAVPTRGARFTVAARFTQNLEVNDSAVLNLSSELNIYFPLSRSFVFALHTGGAWLTGKPEFYQLNKLTGSKTLRGFRKYRFYGESMFYNQAEIQFIRDVRTWLFNGKAGLIALYDIGRVWIPGESSSTWHYGYGGGIMLAPFNKVSLAVFYAYSRNENDFSVRLLKAF